MNEAVKRAGLTIAPEPEPDKRPDRVREPATLSSSGHASEVQEDGRKLHPYSYHSE